MPKISSTENKAMIIKFCLKCVITTVLSVLLLSIISSFLFLKLDLDLGYAKYFAYAIVSLTSFITSIISLISIKHNYILVSLISCIPFLMFIVINGIINSRSIIDIGLKILLIVIFSTAAAVIKSFRRG